MCFVIFGIQFIVFGLIFGVYGILTNCLLKQHYNQFYEKHKFMLYLATIGLSVPTILRGCLNTMRGLLSNSSAISEWVVANEQLYNLLLYLFGSLIPELFQILTLVFGFIRKKNDKKRLKIQDGS